MTPPKCRLCESAHYSYHPHVFASNGATNESASNATRESASNILESDKTAAVSIVRPSVLDRVADKNRGIEQGLDRESGETKNVIDAIPALLAKVDKAAARVLASDVAKHCPPGIKQRWAKDKYNAYQREYMRTRRANLRAGINE